jgi:CheY-like chemotaxis protein
MSAPEAHARRASLPTLPRPRWGREPAVPDGDHWREWVQGGDTPLVAGTARAGERAGGACAQSGCQAVSAPEAHARRAYRLAPTLARPRWGRELPVPDGDRWREWVQGGDTPLVAGTARAGERAGGACAQSGCQAVSAPEAHACRASPPPQPAPAGGGCRRFREGQ